MAVFAIGDIHGQFNALKSLIDKIDLKPDDYIIFLGDYVDRGPDWFDVIKYIMSLSYNNICKVSALWGNHDIMMHDSIMLFKDSIICPNISVQEKREIWFYNGGRKTYNKFISLSPDDKILVSDFFKSLKTDISVTVNNQEYVLCHSLPEDTGISLWDSVWARLFWNDNGSVYCESDINEKILFEKYKNKTIIHGHTPVFNYIDFDSNESNETVKAFAYKIKNVQFIDIDLGAGSIGRFSGANLCVLRLDDMKEFYAI